MGAQLVQSGLVRLNGQNADCEDLFLWLWNNLADAQAAVSTGRGGTAAADWAAGTKTIALPNMQAGVPWGLDDMGASAAGAFASTTFGNGDATTGGSHIAANTVTLAETNLPAHSHGVGTFTISTDGAHVHGVTDPQHRHTTQVYTTGVNVTGAGSVSVPNIASGTSSILSSFASTGISIQSDGAHNHTLSGETASIGSDTAFAITPRGILGTWFLKL